MQKSKPYHKGSVVVSHFNRTQQEFSPNNDPTKITRKHMLWSDEAVKKGVISIADRLLNHC